MFACAFLQLGAENGAPEELKKGKLLYRVYGGAQTQHSRPNASVTTSPATDVGVSTSKDTQQSADTQDPVQEIADGTVSLMGSVQAAQKAMAHTVAESQKKLAEVDRKIEAAEVVLTDPKSVKRYKDLQAQAQQLRQTIDSYTAAMERLAQPQAPTGRPLTQEEAEALVEEMEAGAETAPEMELTPENWVSQFGEDGMVQTPLGAVKMGDNQYLKFAQKGRSGKLGMVKPTLENPDVIVEDKSFANEGQKTERASSYVFIKAFKKVDGSRYYLFTSVTVSKDGNEVVISNQEKSSNKISKLLQNGKITWIKESSLHPITQDGKPVSLNDSNKSTKSGSQPALLGINSPAIPDKDTQSSDNTEYFCNFVLGDHHSDCFCCFDVYCLIQIYKNFRYFTNNQCINN